MSSDYPHHIPPPPVNPASAAAGDVGLTATNHAPTQPFQLDSTKSAGFCLCWSRAETNVDIDVQGVVVDTSGRIVEAVYYNNLKGCGRAITHTGDEKQGEDAMKQQQHNNSNTEKITLHFSKLNNSRHRDVQLVVLLVACFSRDHSLNHVHQGEVRVTYEGDDHGPAESIAVYPLNAAADATCLLMGIVYRTTSGKTSCGDCSSCSSEVTVAAAVAVAARPFSSFSFLLINWGAGLGF
eukprot:GHVS01009019.1.p1 GENE.GHVS01009019.1~~GHVS01009019.1.p1  ORF type:complete len:238 (+),score=40.04 GHVS01009019.1:42-755(+)